MWSRKQVLPAVLLDSPNRAERLCNTPGRPVLNYRALQEEESWAREEGRVRDSWKPRGGFFGFW